MSNRFLDALAQNQTILADGATGTNLFAMGLQSGDAPEVWNLEKPDNVRALHRGFVDAGSNLILTNSFGGNRYRLKLHNWQDRVHEVNKRAAELAREIAGDEVIVAGSMGPTGEILEPVGTLSHEDAVAAFAEQAEALAEGGADVLWIETISSVEEVRAAVEGCRQTGLPVVGTMSFDTVGKTMMGLSPADYADLAASMELDAFGANCGVGPPDMMLAILEMAGQKTGRPIIAKANCGVPKFEDGEIVYTGTPEQMANFAAMSRDVGARVVGGCCGTTSEHIARMRAALDSDLSFPATPEPDAIQTALGDFVNAPSDEPAPTRERRSRRRR